MLRCTAFVHALAALVAVRAGAQTIQTHFATVNGVRLHYLEAGSGPPVILLHGFGETSHMWLPLIPKLAASHTVIAPDLPGAGESSVPDSGYDKLTMARDIHALAERQGWKSVRIVGHDIGLMVAYAYAALYPKETERIVLMDAFIPGVGKWQSMFLLRDLWHFHFYGKTPLALVQGRERIYLDHFWNDFAADAAHSIPEADRRLYTATFARPRHVWAGMEWFRAFDQDATEFAGLAKTTLTQPMLVLSGEKSGGDFLIDQARLVDSHVEGVVVKGSGHWLMEEAQGQVIPKLVEFLDQ
ncbi:MAG: alpha/beta fold hydrolase [Gemmatimonadales bacterium]